MDLDHSTRSIASPLSTRHVVRRMQRNLIFAPTGANMSLQSVRSGESLLVVNVPSLRVPLMRVVDFAYSV